MGCRRQRDCSGREHLHASDVSYNDPPLNFAIQSGDVQLVEYMLNMAADTNLSRVDCGSNAAGVQWTLSETPLDAAIATRDPRMIKYLLGTCKVQRRNLQEVLELSEGDGPLTAALLMHWTPQEHKYYDRRSRRVVLVIYKSVTRLLPAEVVEKVLGYAF